VNINLQTGATPCGAGGGHPRVDWEKSYGPTAPTCLFDGESLPFRSNGVPGAERCDGSAATCIVTAIPAP
jgi:hypothetical protein